MPITINPSVETPPSTVRVFKVLFNNGVTKKNESNEIEWVEKPYVEVILMRCSPILDGEGAPMNNSFGLPAYQDSGWVSSLRISDPAKLASYLDGVWGPTMTAAYAEAEAAGEALQWRKIR